MDDFYLLQKLKKYEIDLHRSEPRKNHQQLCALLHHDFLEIGRSGQTYDRNAIILALENEAPYQVWSQDYVLKIMSVDVALLTYKAAKLRTDGQLENCSIRSSLWKLEREQWKMIFHQGTALDGFEKNSNS
ncbi:nuclear transport factor 2 family protein [Deefgea piscis]|uniref:nuclear transport factor 2 family protein n=1 Tax=Deefgea piscis TaxID=2739061 RepID=UPI001C81E57F|nr:DUF4440 domain-containing protein [Deefgea piscis]QZA80909.1 DUF4440 domain-containing protein [Deefgea piscis]